MSVILKYKHKGTFIVIGYISSNFSLGFRLMRTAP
jgi:hypothetical protein